MEGLEKARERIGMTQGAMADQLGISQAFVSQLECLPNKYPTSIKLIRRMEKLLDLPRNYFFDKMD